MDNINKVSRSSKIKNIILKVITYFFLICCAIAVLFPFYYMILTSLKSRAQYNSEMTPNFFIKKPTFENFIFAFKSANLGREFLNTIIFSLSTTFLMVIVSILASFAFARLNFKGKNIVFTIFLSLMMIPNELIVITNYVTITNLGLRNTFTGLILPSITSVFYIYLLRENFMQISDTLYSAAKMDGTSDFKYLTKVMIPLCKPTIVSIIILKLIECWNSYVWPRLITDNKLYYLVSNGIQEIRESGFGRENIPAMMAAVCVVSLPLLVIFLVFRKQIMTGVSKSGTKG